MKLVYNKTQNAYTRLDNAVQLYVGKGQKDLHSTFAIIVHIGDKAAAPLAFFTEEQKAIECLESIIDFWLTGEAQVLEIENEMKESILVVPESMKAKMN